MINFKKIAASWETFAKTREQIRPKDRPPVNLTHDSDDEGYSSGDQGHYYLFDENRAKNGNCCKLFAEDPPTSKKAKSEVSLPSKGEILSAPLRDAVTIKCSDSALKGNQIVVSAHDAVQEVLKPYKPSIFAFDSDDEDSSDENDNGADKQPYAIGNRKDWLTVVGTLYDKISRVDIKHDIKPGEYLVGPSKVHLSLEQSIFKKNGTEIKEYRLFVADKGFKANFYQTPMKENWGPQYKEIVNVLNQLKANLKVSDAEIAKIQLQQLVGGKPKTGLSVNILKFSDFLNCLMFGLEASRNNLSYATGLMALELIEAGKLSYEQCFMYTLYPMASSGSGGKHMTSRAEMITATQKEKATNSSQIGFKFERQNPIWQQVALKEAMIIKDWLMMKGITKEMRKLTLAEAKQRIYVEVQNLLNQYFSEDDQGLAEEAEKLKISTKPAKK